MAEPEDLAAQAGGFLRDVADVSAVDRYTVPSRPKTRRPTGQYERKRRSKIRRLANARPDPDFKCLCDRSEV